jgi:prepilin-type N-terminal cleavage/methylation domain-containing protein
MTCPPRNDPSPEKASNPLHQIRSDRGFTLLEIVIVLLIIAVITGGSIAALTLNSSEHKLRKASNEIELLAKKARTAAILNQTPYAIEFHPGFVRLLPYSKISEIERTTALGRSIGGEADGSARQEISIDADITLGVRRWNTTEFISPNASMVPVWRFDPEGLSEPLTVRLTVGDSYAQDTYHPLTATIADSELEAN